MTLPISAPAFAALPEISIPANRVDCNRADDTLILLNKLSAYLGCSVFVQERGESLRYSDQRIETPGANSVSFRIEPGAKPTQVKLSIAIAIEITDFRLITRDIAIPNDGRYLLRATVIVKKALAKWNAANWEMPHQPETPSASEEDIQMLEAHLNAQSDATPPAHAPPPDRIDDDRSPDMYLTALKHYLKSPLSIIQISDGLRRQSSSDAWIPERLFIARNEQYRNQWQRLAQPAEDHLRLEFFERKNRLRFAVVQVSKGKVRTSNALALPENDGKALCRAVVSAKWICAKWHNKPPEASEIETDELHALLSLLDARELPPAIETALRSELRNTPRNQLKIQQAIPSPN